MLQKHCRYIYKCYVDNLNQKTWNLILVKTLTAALNKLLSYFGEYKGPTSALSLLARAVFLNIAFAKCTKG